MGGQEPAGVDAMKPTVICSFYVERKKEFPDVKTPYLDCLRILDRSCQRFGFDHVVLTDCRTTRTLTDAGFRTYFADLPDSLMRATTEIQARWLSSPYSAGADTVFVGADCIIRNDFRASLPACDLAIAYMQGHKRWRMNNGFMAVPDESREKVAPLFRWIANDTGVAMCEDMIAIERALSPMPPDFGTYRRRALDVAFLPLPKWNRYMQKADDAAEDAFVLHFMGGWDDAKALFFQWADRHGFA
jgi:hypothetical protein